MKNFILSLISKFRISKYNEYSREKYFRKLGFSVGYNNRIFIKYLSSEPYLIKIGNHCTIAEGVRLITHDGGCWIFREEFQDLNIFGKIEIKDNCFIGMNTIILPNVVIGPNSVIGAGAVVTKDVPPDTVVAGVPAKVICSTEEYKKKCIRRWGELGLQGSRETWEKQLREYFWGEKSGLRT